MAERDTGLRTAERLPTNQEQQRLGGFFETGGMFGFTSTTNKFGVYAYPFLTCTDQLEVRVKKLEKFGGLVKTRPNGSSKWYLKGGKAAELALSARKYLPSREPIMDAYMDWLYAADRQEKASVAEKAKGLKGQEVPIEAYLELIKNPAFLAGVLDARGNIIYVSEDTGKKPRLLIMTRNLALLKAIEAMYGGSFSDRITATGGRSMTLVIERKESLARILSQANNWWIQSKG